MDILSDLCKTLRLQSCLFARPRFFAPWGLYQPACNLIPFHFIVSGSCCLKIEEGRAFSPLAAGDLVLFPRGQAHILADTPRSKVLHMNDVFGEKSPEEIEKMVIGGSGAETVIICGCFSLDRRVVHPLLLHLPPLIQIRRRKEDRGAWIGTILNAAASEILSPRSGSDEIVIRFLDIIFIETIRTCMEGLSEGDLGWLAGLKNPQIGAALGWIHQKPEAPWTVASLAEKIGMSRSAFAEKFSKMVGEPPLHYLNRWRIQKAVRFMEDPTVSLKEIASSIGYSSDEVFSRAFKRYVRVTPGAYRKQRSHDGHLPIMARRG